MADDRAIWSRSRAVATAVVRSIRAAQTPGAATRPTSTDCRPGRWRTSSGAMPAARGAWSSSAARLRPARQVLVDVDVHLLYGRLNVLLRRLIVQRIDEW